MSLLFNNSLNVDDFTPSADNEQAIFLNLCSSDDSFEQNEFVDQINQLQNDQKKHLERINELEKQLQQQNMQQKDKKYVSTAQLDKIFGRIGELETQLKKQQNEKVPKSLIDQIKQLQNDQQKHLERIAELEKQNNQHFYQLLTSAIQQKLSDRIFSQQQNDQKKQTEFCDKISELEKNTNECFGQIWNKFFVLENFVGILKDRFRIELLKAVPPDFHPKIIEKFSIPPKNCWDVNACHSNIEIVGINCLTVNYKGNGYGSSSVFSKCAVLCSDSGIFYFEIMVKNAKNFVSIGLATKGMQLYERVGHNLDTYGYQNNGTFSINGTAKIENFNAKFGNCDVVGCGFSFATRQIFFTKNGLRFETADLFLSQICSSLLFPSVSLNDFGDEIEANFGPNFKFDFANAKMLPKQKLLQNYWDVSTCHNELTIYGSNNLMVHRHGNELWSRSVFAKHSILNSSVGDDAAFSDIFYFEILVKNMKNCSIFGFAVKHRATVDLSIRGHVGTYAFESKGFIWVNGSWKMGNKGFGNGDVVGFGVNLATNKQLFFTKNGQRIGPSNLSICSPSAAMDQLFPFVSLINSEDKIEANFGPKFLFDLTTLC